FEQIKANEQGAPCSGESEQEMSCSREPQMEKGPAMGEPPEARPWRAQNV
ncbi:unnamed protein product, partial [Effrenium voratum]